MKDNLLPYETPSEPLEDDSLPVPHDYDQAEAARLKAKTDEIKNQKIYIAALEDALCEQDAANEERLAAIEDALCELDKEE